jgi:TolB-like protein
MVLVLPGIDSEVRSLSNLFAELKRRNVVRVGIAYLVIGWVLIEVSGTIAPMMGLPEWAPNLILYVLILGLPVALFCSWAYELTPQGVKKTAEVDADDSITPSTGRRLDRFIIAALMVALGYFVWDKFGGQPAAEASIAVLPFVNLSSDPEQEYFSDGISEELLNVLAQIPDLRVAARTSSFQFKGENRDVADIARQLRVAHILEGSVRKSGTRLRITAQLIDAEDGFHIWSETYDRELTDIFTVQDEISQAIVGALIKRLGLTAAAVVPKVQAAASTEAYEAYLLGIHEMEKRGGGPLTLAAGQFEKALEIDPDYVPAMARLAMTYILLPGYDFENNPSGEMQAKALPLAEKALAAAPDLPEAQAAMGFYLWQGGDHLAAEPYLSRTVALNPSYATVRVWLADLNGQMGRYDLQLEMLEAAVRVDPLSRLSVNNLAEAYRERKMPDKALPLIERLRSLSPLLYGGKIASMLEEEGRLAEAALAWLEVLAIDKDYNNGRNGFATLLEDQFGLYEEAIRYGWFAVFSQFASGRPEAALALVAALEPVVAADNVNALTFFGSVYFVAGEAAKARETLEAAWKMIPERPDKVGGFGGNGALSLILLRQEAGDVTGAKELIDLGLAFLDGREAANMAGPRDLWSRGLAFILDNKKEEGLALMQSSVEAGYGPDYMDTYLMRRFSDLDFDPVMASFEARRERERDKFLKAVCNDGNPAPEVWTPLPSTCAGHIEAGS